MRIVDDNLHTIFCYEHILPAENGWDRKYGDFDAHVCYDVGLFYVYSTKRDVIESFAVCKTKDFVERLYMTFLCFAGFQGGSKKRQLDFTQNWYWDTELGFMNETVKGMTWDDIKLKWNNWTFYNELKSTKVEWNAVSDLPYRHNNIHFQKPAKVNEMINMWAEWGDALFWYYDGCCGDCTVINTASGDIDLSGIDGLKDWYEEFDNSEPCAEWPKEKQDKWYKRGWQLSIKVRELLPDNIDLCYYWLPSKYEIKDVAPMMRLVPNRRFWISQ